MIVDTRFISLYHSMNFYSRRNEYAYDDWVIMRDSQGIEINSFNSLESFRKEYREMYSPHE